MFKNQKLLFISLIALIFSIQLNAESQKNNATENKPAKNNSILGDRKADTLSEQKILKIEEIVKSYIANNSNIKNKDIRDEIVQKVNSIYKINPNTTSYSIDASKLMKQAQKMAEEKYPDSKEDLTKQYTSEADQLFKPVEINSTVTIKYKQGPFVKTVSGKYYGLTPSGNAVKIGNSVIPVFDMSDSDKFKFDETILYYKKKNFIADNIEKYDDEKQLFKEKYTKTALDALIDKNESNGYIYIWNQWRTPEDVTDKVINYFISKEILNNTDNYNHN